MQGRAVVVVWLAACAAVCVARPSRFLVPVLAQSSSEGGEADEVAISHQGMWDAVPQDAKTREFRVHKPSTTCNNCLRPPIEHTPGVGEGVVLCYFWSDTLSNVTAFPRYMTPQKQCAGSVEAVDVCVRDRDPEAPVTVFGNKHSFVRNGRFVYNQPESDAFHQLQGYMLHPVEGGKETVHITVSLELDAATNPCPRPPDEFQHVDWAVFHSRSLQDANMEGHFATLDSGSFVVTNGRVEGKTHTSAPLFVGGFTGDQVISLWVRVRFDTDNANARGMLVLKDNTNFEFIGECKRECMHCDKPAGCSGEECTGCLNEHLCKCECVEPWQGRNCSECSRHCAHGSITPECMCKCSGLWQGTLCDQCNLDCGEGGVIDEDNCVCKCRGNWEKDAKTGECTVCPLKCQHKADSSPNGDCECECDHDKGWMGTECEVCHRQCTHGDLNEETCTCSCDADHWEGGNVDPICEVCNRDCEHRDANTRLLMDTCTCINCPYPWTGQWCHICARDTCQHGHLLNATLASGATHRDEHNRVVQTRDFSKLTCFSKTQDDCSCCCDSLFSSPSEDPRYETLRFSGDHCEVVPNPCPSDGYKTEAKGLSFPGLDCKPCLGNWEGRMCDECNFQCAHGTTNGNPHCRCNCQSGWRHGDNTNTGNNNGQCEICEPRAVGGPSCPESESNPSVGFDCHGGFKNKKRSGKCNNGEHLCTAAEIQRAFSAGWRDSVGTWRQFFTPNTLVSAQPIKCVKVHTRHAQSGNWGGNRLHFVDWTQPYAHAVVRHTSGSDRTTTVCLPQASYRIYVCGATYSTSTRAVKISSVSSVDLSGDMRYMVNVGGGATGRWSSSSSTSGFSIWTSQGGGEWACCYDLGDSSFNYVMGTINWSVYGHPVDVSMSVEQGVYYKLQLLMQERCCTRRYDVYVNGNKVYSRFSVADIGQSSQHGFAALVHQFVSPSTTLTVRLYGDPNDNGMDRNPVLSGVTLEKMGAGEAFWYIEGVNEWTQGSQHDCSLLGNGHNVDLTASAVGTIPNDNILTEPNSLSYMASYFSERHSLDSYGSLCCSDQCTAHKYCDGYNCNDCPTCPSGKFSTCAGNSAGSCQTCSSNNCASGQTYVAAKCGGFHNGCVDSGCAATGCP